MGSSRGGIDKEPQDIFVNSVVHVRVHVQMDGWMRMRWDINNMQHI